MARGSDERNFFKSFTSDQGGLSCKGFEALSNLKQSHIKIYFCIFLDCSQLNIYPPFNFNFSKPTSRNRHNADFKYNCVHLKQIHQHIRVKSSSTINRLMAHEQGLFLKEAVLGNGKAGVLSLDHWIPQGLDHQQLGGEEDQVPCWALHLAFIGQEVHSLRVTSNEICVEISNWTNGYANQ